MNSQPAIIRNYQSARSRDEKNAAIKDGNNCIVPPIVNPLEVAHLILACVGSSNDSDVDRDQPAYCYCTCLPVLKPQKNHGKEQRLDCN